MTTSTTIRAIFPAAPPIPTQNPVGDVELDALKIIANRMRRRPMSSERFSPVYEAFFRTLAASARVSLRPAS